MTARVPNIGEEIEIHGGKYIVVKVEYLSGEMYPSGNKIIVYLQELIHPQMINIEFKIV